MSFLAGHEKEPPKKRAAESLGRSRSRALPRNFALRRPSDCHDCRGSFRLLVILSLLNFSLSVSTKLVYRLCFLTDSSSIVVSTHGLYFNIVQMPLSPFLRIAPRLGPTVARRSRRAASTLSGSAPKPQSSLDSILIANRGEIALYVYN